jgi:hypothetical protein
VLSIFPDPAAAPTTWYPWRSGRLNVVVPSPVPNRVETIENKDEYVDLDTA